MKITFETENEPLETLGARVREAIGDEPAVATTLLFAAANTPRAAASVYAAALVLLKNTVSVN